MRDPGLPRLVAHRGVHSSSGKGAVENTLAALLAARDSPATAVEVDLRHTADGVAAVVHDATLERLWDDPRRVADLTWPEVVEATHGGVPRLEDVIDAASRDRIPLVLDMTEPDDARAGAQAVRSVSSLPPIAWCGAPAAMAVVRAELPEADVWLEWVALAPPHDAALAPLRPSTINVDVALLTPTIVEDAHRRGLEVACWTVDDPAVARWAAGLGVDSITTNDVSRVAAALESPPDPEEEVDAVLERAHRLALDVGREIVAFTRAHPVSEVATKAHPADLVTDVDRAVEQEVRGRVRAAFPGHGFTGEEFGVAPGDAWRWYLDPVDGTTNLVNQVPWTSMSLCLAHDGVPAVGVVADPWRGEILDARRGRGARAGERTLRLDPDEPRTLVGAVVGTELAGHQPWPGLVAFLDALATRSCTLRIMGSGTLTLAQVAAGRGVGACVSAFDPIDHGAAVLLVLEAGGVVLTPTGRCDGFPELGEPVLVAHPAIADELAGVWRSALGAPSPGGAAEEPAR